MKYKATTLILIFFTIFLLAVPAYWFVSKTNRFTTDNITLKVEKKGDRDVHEEEKDGPENELQEQKERADYFFKLLKDPATNAIPKNIRAHELNHARRMPAINGLRLKGSTNNTASGPVNKFDWRIAGPKAVGGRTRALGIDQRNPNIIIAGGVSGGIWKSTDGGTTWDLKTPNFTNFSVTSLAQDLTEPDTWYYASGERKGNSASAPGARYRGTGLFRSTDNGSSWNIIPGTKDSNTRFDSKVDFVSRLIISPTTGSVFVASNASGIFRSTNGIDFKLALGGTNIHKFYDIAVASNGTLAAILSTANFKAGGNPGIFISKDDGQSWNEFTPKSFPARYGESKLSFAPSNPNIIYVFTQKLGDATNQGVSLYKLNLVSNPADAVDRGGNLPDFGGVGGINVQGGYNMTVSVKPDDPNFVTVGATDLFRSRDGFATAPSDNSQAQKDEFWIGGYAKANNVSLYPNQHPDQHVQVYDPTDADRLWVGHDGGLSVTNDVTANAVNWNDKNDGYFVTQFYDASIPAKPQDNRLMGGTQDNGTPFFINKSQDNQNLSIDISTGDGAYSFFSKDFIFASSQHGRIRRCPQNAPQICRFGGRGFSYVQPSQASNTLFINPYAVDPNDDKVMYYPGGSQLFRNTEIDQLDSGNGDGTTRGWELLTNASLSSQYIISALTISDSPANILYYAGFGSGVKPLIKRLDKAKSSNNTSVDISIPNAATGAFVHDIAVNPRNANDVLVTMSNYNIVGIYHSLDGGASWQAVEGNLRGDDDPRSNNAGPSIRSATIVPAKSGTVYLVGTSTGVYATGNLSGNTTQWVQESPFNNDDKENIGFSVVEDITSRAANGDVAVGTHGRGMFIGDFGGIIAKQPPAITLKPLKARAGETVVITALNFSFATTPSANKVTFNGVDAKINNATPNKLTVLVPRATLKPQDGRKVKVQVAVKNGARPPAKQLTILRPENNELNQNFPNPFTNNSQTVIPISLKQSSKVTIFIYDTAGRRVFEPLRDKSFQAGTFNINVDFSGKASGIYIYRIIAKPTASGDNFVDSKKFTFIK